ncbi:hypothetical protein V6N12_075595 [Hibiscus sabdariffa]|uniref:Uncharacterized protein n=1 Tax=Hibiscus sabdariffa TaxID=183260 RepID=A0ABR2C812_9ROSI
MIGLNTLYVAIRCSISGSQAVDIIAGSGPLPACLRTSNKRDSFLFINIFKIVTHSEKNKGEGLRTIVLNVLLLLIAAAAAHDIQFSK